jgi:hypothetical protein
VKQILFALVFIFGLAIAGQAQNNSCVRFKTKVIEPTTGDNHQNVTSTVSILCHLTYFNNSGTIAYGRLYDLASFNGCNSATGLVYEFHIPANTNDAGAVDNIGSDGGLGFTNGIAVCITGAYGQTDTSSPPTNAISVNIGYNQ